MKIVGAMEKAMSSPILLFFSLLLDIWQVEQRMYDDER